MAQFERVGTLEEVLSAQIARAESTDGAEKLDAINGLLKINKEMLKLFCSADQESRTPRGVPR